MWVPDYVTLSAMKHYLRMDPADNQDDIELSNSITAASRAVDRYCSNRRNGLGARRQFGQDDNPVSRYYTPRWDSKLLRWVIEIDDVMDSTGLALIVDTSNNNNYNQTITNYVLRPLDALANKRPYTQIAVSTSSTVQPTYFPDSAKVTVKFGWTSVPEVVVNSTKIQAHRFFKRRQAPFGVAGSPSKGTSDSILDDIDPDIELMLNQMDLVKLGWTT